MKLKFVWIILLIIIVSCVPRKKLIYLQSDVTDTYNSYLLEEREYILKPKDLIAVSIFSLTPGQFDIFRGGGNGSTEPGSSQNNVNLFKIDTAGYVELPAIGKVKVDGLTINQAQDKIKTLLEDYLQLPLVRITLQTPFEFTILGEVNNPGHYMVVGDRLTIFEAIGLAGDLSVYADRKEIKLVRKSLNGTSNIKKINLLEADILGDEDFFIQSNDLILVDPLAARSVRENQVWLISTAFGLLSSFTWFFINITRD
ncbi:MAG: polysaccharide biosynthesis/export family protein [Candidatus Cyclobacteriaceae bacterium M3_2C_046]